MEVEAPIARGKGVSGKGSVYHLSTLIRSCELCYGAPADRITAENILTRDSRLQSYSAGVRRGLTAVVVERCAGRFYVIGVPCQRHGGLLAGMN